MEEIDNLNKKINELEKGNKISNILQIISYILIVVGIVGNLLNFKLASWEMILILILICMNTENGKLNRKINILNETIRNIAAKKS